MNKLQKGLLFAAIQVALVSSLGAKLLWDRANEPRGWALTRGYDPDLIIRGRYVSISLLVKADKVFGDLAAAQRQGTVPSYNSSVSLAVENGRVIAIPADHSTGLSLSSPEVVDGETLATVYPPVVYFLPEHAANPLQRHAVGTNVLEVTIPKKGPPRPIRFGIKVGDHITPLPED
ncbi:MAG TPA: hypothetical protein VE077_08780 [Candidatus Methylomirabilis sp.]|nr:hypothetical protein [Candidatus Methylomirabilis sp.]